MLNDGFWGYIQDWACEPAQLQAAEEDEQPKVAVRRLILETRPM